MTKWKPYCALAAALLACTLLHPMSARADAEASGSRTLGFVVRDWMTAVYETKFIAECPAGLNISNDEIWWRSLSMP